MLSQRASSWEFELCLISFFLLNLQVICISLLSIGYNHLSVCIYHCLIAESLRFVFYCQKYNSDNTFWNSISFKEVFGLYDSYLCCYCGLYYENASIF